MQNREESNMDMIVVKKRGVERRGKISCSERGRGIKIVFRPKYRPLKMG
jgi:hypothetical protein